jgi:hypothetical protein
MELHVYLARLTHQAEAIARLVEGVAADHARWKPAPEAWSILEVINHLYDEEIEDFRLRLQITLRDPNEAWPRIDPVGNVTARSYNTRDLGASLENFLDERTVSLEWLRSLENPDWAKAHRTTSGRMVSAGDLLISWVAHDLLHLRQLVELQYLYQRHVAPPYDVGYAGDW